MTLPAAAPTPHRLKMSLFLRRFRCLGCFSNRKDICSTTETQVGIRAAQRAAQEGMANVALVTCCFLHVAHLEREFNLSCPL